MLFVKNTNKYGRGVYAARAIETGELVEASPVLILDEWESDKINPTVLNCYVFAWDDNHKRTAVAFGFGSLFNHSTKENITYKNNYKNNTIEFMALRDIKKGEQLFVDYGYDVADSIKVTKDNRKLALRNENGT